MALCMKLKSLNWIGTNEFIYLFFSPETKVLKKPGVWMETTGQPFQLPSLKCTFCSLHCLHFRNKYSHSASIKKTKHKEKHYFFSNPPFQEWNNRDWSPHISWRSCWAERGVSPPLLGCLHDVQASGFFSQTLACRQITTNIKVMQKCCPHHSEKTSDK